MIESETTPVDTSSPGPAADKRAGARCHTAILMHRGRCILTLEDDAALPGSGTLFFGGERRAWTAVGWPHGDGAGYAGIAIVDDPVLSAPAASWRLETTDEAGSREVAPPQAFDLAPAALAAFVLTMAGDPRPVFDLLVSAAGSLRDEVAEATIQFAKSFLAATARQDGFVEIVAAPDGGGLFVQGWSMSLAAGDHAVTDLGAKGAAHALVVATFERDDILPPGTGFCGFSKDVRAPILDMMNALFVSTKGGLLRFDLTPSAAQRLGGAEATQHVRAVLPRLAAPDPMLRAFKRVCRPIYGGENTLDGCGRPVALALDTALRSPRGDLFLQGWLLDPCGLVDRVIVKTTQHGYGPLHDRWVRLPRTDLDTAFKDDHRFRGLLGQGGSEHGFIVTVPATDLRAIADIGEAVAELYLELVFEDESCVFVPFAAADCDEVGKLQPSVKHLNEVQPSFQTLVRQHLRPFVDGIPKRRLPAAPVDGHRSSPSTSTAVSILMPLRRATELPPVLSALAGSPEGAEVELLLTASGEVAQLLQTKVGVALDFYGLSGRLVTAPAGCLEVDELTLALATSSSRLLLVWRPTVLPSSSGWLADLLQDYSGLEQPALLSPTLLFEDGSIAYGGECDGGRSPHAMPRFTGYSPAWLPDGGPREVASGSRDFFLVARDTLARIGGLGGAMASNAYTHLDLAERLAEVGGRCFWTASTKLWLLDEHVEEGRSGWPAIARHLDAVALDERFRGDGSATSNVSELAARAPVPRLAPVGDAR